MGKLNLMASLGYETTAEGLPIIDSTALFDPNTGGHLSARDRDRFLSATAEVMRTLAACMSPDNHLDPAPTLKQYSALLNLFRHGTERMDQ